jgi:CelD/BcsL family acetyltransferase involved in cellulose biosynthesis
MTDPHLSPQPAPPVEVDVDHRLARLRDHFRESSGFLDWSSPFLLPGWIEAWCDAFPLEDRPWVVSARQDGRLTGVAALLQQGDALRLAGDPRVCDHMDIVCDPQRAEGFCAGLLQQIGGAGIRILETGPVRPDSAVMTRLVPEARRRGFTVGVAPDETVYSLDLPDSWEGYLLMLSGKQRHEVRRKLRRLEQMAAFGFRLSEAPAAVARDLDAFLGLFRQNRADKAAFMNRRMEGYFRSLAERLPETRIAVLEIDGAPAAAVMCFDHRGVRYLYNSGFDARLGHLSVGWSCKVLSIREAVRRGLKTYDFLKGDEPYKRRLGGRPVVLYRCRIEFAG